MMKVITALMFLTSLNFAYCNEGQRLPLPTQKDINYAKALSPTITKSALKHLKKISPNKKYRLSAAREGQGVIYLEFQWIEGKDGNEFLIYNQKSKKFTSFQWYIQG